MKGFSVVAAMDRNRGIGLNGRLPWRLSGDMRFFQELTTCPDRHAVEQRHGLARRATEIGQPILPTPSPENRNAVLMGRNTWEGLPASFKPLPNRLNGVLSRSGLTGNEGTRQTWPSLKEAMAALGRDESVSGVFVIGGAQIYSEAVGLPECERLYLTDIEGVFPCDVFFPEIPSGFREAAASDWIEEAGIRYRFRRLQRGIK